MVSQTRNQIFSSIRSRNLAAVLMALVTATIIIPGMTTYLPLSMADQIALPILLFPFIWTALFIYSYMASQAWHPWVVMLLLSTSHGLLAFFALQGSQ